MATVAEIQALLKAKDAMSPVVKRAADNTKRETDRMGKLWSGLSSGIGAAMKGAAVALGGLGAGILVTANMAADAEEAEALLAQTVKTMGANAWTSVDQLKAHAAEIMGITKFDDDAVVSMQGLLLTFGDVKNVVGEGNDVFDRATDVVADLATKMGTDLQPQALMVGKALNDPVLGLTAMRRVGIQFTDSQEDMIKKMAESGDTLGAQKIILGELEKQFGGTAEAAAAAGTGPMVQFKNVMGEIGEMVGGVTLPYLQDLAKWASTKGQEILAFFESPAGQMWIEKIRDGVERVLEKFKEWGEWLSADFKGHMDRGLTPMQAIVKTAGDIAEKLFRMIPQSVRGNIDGLGAALAILAGPMGLIVRDLLPALKPVIDAVLPVLAQMANDLAPQLAEILAVIAETAIPVLVDVLGGLADILREHPEIIAAVVAGFVAFKTVMLVQFVAQAIPKVLGAMGALKAAFLANPWAIVAAAVVALVVLIVTNWDTILAFLKKAWKWITDNAARVGQWLKDKFKQAVDFLYNLFLNFTPLGLIIKHFDKIKELAAGVGTWIKDKFDDVVDFFTKLPGRIADAVSGMWNGIKSAFKEAINWILRQWNDFSLTFSIPNPFGDDFTMKLDTPNIPLLKFHEGGMVPGRPGQDVPIIAQAGERIIPANADDVRGGPAIGELHVHQNMDPFMLADTIAWRLRTSGI